MKTITAITFVLMHLLLFNHVYADNFATTDDGKRVILKTDGRWKYITEKSQQSDLSYKDSMVKISFQSCTIKKQSYRDSFITELVIDVTVVSSSKIINPKTHRVYGYEEGSDVGGRMPWGFKLSDSFGNDLKVSNVKPSYIGYKEQGMRPEESKKFTITSNDYPLHTASFVVLSVSKKVFGNEARFELKIPSDQIIKPKELTN